MMSLFYIGLLITIIGIIACAYLFVDAQKVTKSFSLGIAQTQSVETPLLADDIGFFRVYTPDFVEGGGAIFVQILDPSTNIIADKKIETKMAINYFDIDKDGSYTAKATNLSHNSLYFEIEFGQTNSQQLIYPAALIFVGIAIVIIAAYKRLKNYSTAQPDENAA